jgi:hypothetical protein
MCDLAKNDYPRESHTSKTRRPTRCNTFPPFCHAFRDSATAFPTCARGLAHISFCRRSQADSPCHAHPLRRTVCYDHTNSRWISSHRLCPVSHLATDSVAGLGQQRKHTGDALCNIDTPDRRVKDTREMRCIKAVHDICLVRLQQN